MKTKTNELFNPRLVLSMKLLNQTGPIKLFPMISQYMKTLPKEQAAVVPLDKDKNVIGGLWALSDGTDSRVMVDYESTLKWLKEIDAEYVVLAHNHPYITNQEEEGLENLNPSPDDVHTTMAVADKFREEGIQVLDAVIVGGGGDLVSITRTLENITLGIEAYEMEKLMWTLRKGLH